MKRRFGVVTFPGSNCDSDCHYAVKLAGAEPVMIWHESPLPDVDCVILPGGFSYGDYLRAGALVAASPIMEQIARYSAGGGLVLGICNGFQILVETGLLPGALLKNKTLKFIHKTVYVKSVGKTPFTYLIDEGSVLKMPIAHSEGCYFSNNGNFQTVFQYCSKEGIISETYNPNGSVDSVAGIVNEKGNVCGMMPHPERAVEKILGSDDGLRVFKSIIAWLDKFDKN